MKHINSRWMGTFVPILLLLLTLSGAALAQKKISGKVTDGENNAPLPGVSIVVKGTTVGTTSDANGNYSLNLPANASSLIFSFVGFTSQEVAIGNQSTLDVSMKPDDRLLDEIVVTGYLTEQKKDIVGSVATVAPKDLVAIPMGNVQQQLQGRVAGLTVTTSGQPGVQSSVRVRGFTTLGNNDPLYIVDGVPLNNIEDLNGFDIENTTVLKDAGAASIYGARAAAGVIVITTKRGSNKGGKINASYDLQYGIQQPGKRPGILTPQETADFTLLARFRTDPTSASHPQYGTYRPGQSARLPDFINVGGAGGVFAGDPRINPSLYNVNFDNGAIYQIVRGNAAGTDWYGELTAPAPILNQTLSLSGGGDNSRFHVSFGQFDQQGIILNTWLKRYTLRANSEFTIAKKVRIGENFQMTYRNNPGINDRFDLNAAQSENDMFIALTTNPFIPVYDEFGGWGGTAAPGFNNSRNVIADRTRAGGNQGFDLIGLGNLYAEVDPIKDLTLRTSIGGRMGNYYFQGANFRTYERSENAGANSLFEGAGYFYTWTWTNTAQYKKTFGKHTAKAFAGYEYVVNDGFRAISGSGLNPFSMDQAFQTISNTETVGRQVNSGGNPEQRFASVFGRLDYGYDDKYLVNFTLRRDQSSVFGANNRTGVFPAFSAAWRISQENFMKGLTWVDDLKVRGGWGQMGNSRINPNNQFNLYGTTSYDIAGANTGANPALAPGRLGNQNGKWETNTTINVGIDGSLLGGKMDIVVDWYQKKTTDILYVVPLPGVLGNIAAPAVNIATVSNRGLDILVTNRGNITKDLKFVTDLTFTTFTNNIDALAPEAGITFFDAGNATRLGSTSRNQVGSSFGRFFGYQVEGIFQSAEDVRNSPTQDGAAPGRLKFADTNEDGRINADDRTFIGSPIPRFTMGFNFKLTWKNFDVENFFYWVNGADIFNNYRTFTDFYPLFPGLAISDRVRNSWSPENPGGNVPIFENVANFSTNTQVSSYYVENGSYLRWRNLSIGYNLPKNVLDKVGADRLRIFAQVNNLFTITNYTGLDPAISGGDSGFGIDTGGNFPIVRTWMFGASLGF
jgi:TonB-dependent starch-binding outer membrane protein SusC